MQAAICIGIQATGKSTFCKTRLADTHIRLNLDMLRTRHRESVLLKACILAKQPFVSDNTNPTAEDRSRFITPARAAGFKIVGYYFSSKASAAIERNDQRESAVPERAILGTAKRLQLPELSEGFDELWFVSITGPGKFSVERWSDEVR